MENKSQTIATKEDLQQVLARLTRKIDQFKVEMIKWMFAFWVTIVLMFIGIYLNK